MSTLPIPLLINLFLGLLALVLLLAVVGLAYRGVRRYRSLRMPVATYVTPPARTAAPLLKVVERPLAHRISPAAALLDSAVALPLGIAFALLVLTFFGREFVLLAFPSGSDEPRELHSANAQDLARPDGSKLHVETFGKADGPTLVFTHGWGTSNTEWYYAKQQLADRFRLVF